MTFTRARPYRKNDQAHVEQKNFTNVRLWFGYERYDHPDLWRLINTLCRGALHQLLNYFLPTMKLAKKERVGSKTVRTYSPTQTPLERVLGLRGGGRGDPGAVAGGARGAQPLDTAPESGPATASDRSGVAHAGSLTGPPEI